MRLSYLLAVLVVVLTGSCSGPEESDETPSASPFVSPSHVVPVTSSPVPTEAFGPSTARLEPASEPAIVLTRPGGYLLDLQEARLYAASGGVVLSPDPGRAAVLECCSTPGGLVAVDLQGGQTEEIARGYIAFASWSPDGQQLLYSRIEGLPNAFVPAGIYVWSINTHESKMVSAVRDFAGLSWSPVGERILYARLGQVHIFDTKTQAAELVMDLGPEAAANGVAALRWSPQGDKVAACAVVGSSESGLRQEIAVYEVHSRTVSQWGQVDNCQPFLWSPDGSRLLVGGFQDAYTVTDTGRSLLASAVREISWSSDGMQLAFITDGCDNGEFDVFVSSADGSAPRRLTITPDDVEEGLSWAPDSRRLAFAVHSEVSDWVVVVDSTTGSAETVAASASEPLHIHGGAWSPSGRYVTFGLGGAHGICT